MIFGPTSQFHIYLPCLGACLAFNQRRRPNRGILVFTNLRVVLRLNLYCCLHGEGWSDKGGSLCLPPPLSALAWIILPPSHWCRQLWDGKWRWEVEFSTCDTNVMYNSINNHNVQTRRLLEFSHFESYCYCKWLLNHSFSTWNCDTWQQNLSRCQNWGALLMSVLGPGKARRWSLGHNWILIVMITPSPCCLLSGLGWGPGFVWLSGHESFKRRFTRI